MDEKQSKTIFFVEKILDKKIENGKTKYLVKWENSWQREENLFCSELVEEYEESCSRAMKRKNNEIDDTEEPASKRPKNHDDHNDISQIKSSIKNIENILSNLPEDLKTRPATTSKITLAPPPPPPPPGPAVGLIVPKKILESRNSQQTNLLNELNNVFSRANRPSEIKDLINSKSSGGSQQSQNKTSIKLKSVAEFQKIKLKKTN